MEIYRLITVIVVLTALFGYVNHRILKLPATIGIMLISLVISLVVIIVGWLDPALFGTITHIVRTFDFNIVLMQVLLGFLLFAGAIHIDIKC